MTHSTKLILLLLLFLTPAAWGHPTDEWFVNLEIRSESGLTGVFRVPTDQVEALRANPVVLSADGSELDLNWTDTGDDGDGRKKMEVSCPLGHFEELSIKVPDGLLDDNQSLVGFVSFPGYDPVTLLVSPGGEAKIAGSSEGHVAPNSAEFFRLGLTHIIEGYDHLLFLFCLLIAGGTFRHFLVVVTAFTLGHSLTLGASVLGYVSLPPQLTETLIALSIVIAALLNVPWLKKDEAPEDNTSIKSRGILAATFGLVHGLGFAGILKEIGVQGSGVAAPLVGFNLGVEAGQLIIVAAFFPILIAINKWKKRVPFLVGCSYVAALIGAYWVVERLGLFRL